MVPTLKIFGVVSRFLYSGGWQVWFWDVGLPHATATYVQFKTGFILATDMS